MARKFLTKKVVITTVKGFALGEDGTPVPAEIPLAGRYDKAKATKEIHKNHDSNFMVTSTEQSEQHFKIPLTDFLRFATALSADEDVESVESEEDDEAAEEPPAAVEPPAKVEPSKRGKK